jgi:multidrug efflux pump subunit AcrA (membrane-fusion protein)
MKKYLISLLLIVFILPSVAFASWYNPFSWFNGWTFHKTEVAPQSPVETQKTPEEKINDLQKQLDDLKKQQPVSTSTTTTPAVKKIKKAVPVIDNSAIIQAQIDATLKAKTDQDALIAKQKADAQAQIDAQKADAQAHLDAEAKQQAQLKIQQAQDAQAQIDAQNQAQREALQAKQSQLDAVNLKIATLNAKYAKDVSDARSNTGMTLEQSDNVVRYLNSQYTIAYDALQAQWQQIKYSN